MRKSPAVVATVRALAKHVDLIARKASSMRSYRTSVSLIASISTKRQAQRSESPSWSPLPMCCEKPRQYVNMELIGLNKGGRTQITCMYTLKGFNNSSKRLMPITERSLDTHYLRSTDPLAVAGQA
jgi:hypothetical protein